jgi:osmotically-inducible protein OsmY
MTALDRWIRDADELRRQARSRADLAVRGRDGIGTRGVLLIAGLGAALGAATAFLLDPDRGRSRRALYGGKAAAVVRRSVRETGRAARVARAIAAGRIEAARHLGGGDPDLNDATLAAKVETELFRDPSLPKGNLNINVERGIVVLRGQVDSDAQRAEIEMRAAAIPGVWSVRNLTHLAGEPAPREAVLAG